MKPHRLLLLSITMLLSMALALAGCGSDPDNVAGTYTVSLTSGANGCELDPWEVGGTATGVGVVITQDGESVTLEVQGLTGVTLTAFWGSNRFVGEVDGSHIDARLTGRAETSGSCAWTNLIDLEADVDGDVMQGTLRWYRQTNGLESCGIRNGCQSVQAFNGTRPPGSGD